MVWNFNFLKRNKKEDEPSSDSKGQSESEISRKPYQYNLRPAYQSEELLIEFISHVDSKEFLDDLFQILTNNGYKVDEVEDIWMNDEVLIHIDSPNGKVYVSKDIWGCVFILGENNQTELLHIHYLLKESPDFVCKEEKGTA